MRSLYSFILIAALALTGVVTGCDSYSSSQEETVRVSLNIMAAASLDAAGKTADAIPTIDLASVLLRTIQFHSRDDDDAEEGVDFRTEPIAVDLNLDGSPAEFVFEDLPIGTYHKVSFRIHKPEEGEEVEFPDFWSGPGGTERFSVLVEGELDAVPFSYKSSKSMQQQIDFDEDLVLDGTETDMNVTLLVDVNTWFLDDNGNLLDPNDLSAANTSAIDKSIRESFRIFKDKNKDGAPD